MGWFARFRREPARRRWFLEPLPDEKPIWTGFNVAILAVCVATYAIVAFAALALGTL